jgi:putative phosphoesterase
MLIGLISDTHGLVRNDVSGALAGVELILHAGDVGSRDVLLELENIAPVRAVCGNVDPPGLGLPQTLVVEIDGLKVRLTHGNELRRTIPEAIAERYGEDVVVYGHTHRSLVTRVGRSLIVNPGSAGPSRFHLLPSVGLLRVSRKSADVEIVTLAG